MSDFKIGDEVVVVKSDYKHPTRQAGMTGTIVSTYHGGFGVRLNNDEPDDVLGDGWFFTSSEIEKR